MKQILFLTTLWLALVCRQSVAGVPESRNMPPPTPPVYSITARALMRVEGGILVNAYLDPQLPKRDANGARFWQASGVVMVKAPNAKIGLVGGEAVRGSGFRDGVSRYVDFNHTHRKVPAYQSLGRLTIIVSEHT